MPNSPLHKPLVVVAIVTLAILAFFKWQYWDHDYTLTEFSTALDTPAASRVVAQDGRYRFTVQPEQEIMLRLSFKVELANQNSSQGRANSIHLVRRDSFGHGYDFLRLENELTSQEFTFNNGDVVRFYWMAEPIDDNRTAIHTTANHFRNGQLIDTRIDQLEVEFKVDAEADVDIGPVQPDA